MKRSKTMITAFLAPCLILYFFLFLFPAAKAFYVSLFKWNGFTSDMKFVGLGNFKELFSDSHFWKVVMANSFGIIVFGGLLTFTIAFFLSGMIATNPRGKKFMSGLIYIPSIINPVAVAILWSFIYNQKYGLLNGFLRIIGLGMIQPTWTAPDTLFWAILVALVWMYSGFYFVILSSALERVPLGQIESARLEGGFGVPHFLYRQDTHDLGCPDHNDYLLVYHSGQRVLSALCLGGRCGRSSGRSSEPGHLHVYDRLRTEGHHLPDGILHRHGSGHAPDRDLHLPHHQPPGQAGIHPVLGDAQ